MKPLIKNISRTILFVIIFFLILGILSEPFSPIYGDFYNSQMVHRFSGIFGEPDHSIDIVLMGNSESVYAFSPMELWDEYGITAYQCSSPSQNLLLSYEYFTTFLDSQAPTTLVIEAEHLYWNISTEDVLHTAARMYSPVIENHDQWQVMTLNNTTDENSPRYVDDTKGYCINFKNNPPLSDQYMVATDEMEPISFWTQIVFQKMMDLCSKRHIKVLLVSAPSAVNWNMKRHNAIEALAQKYQLPYLDMNLHLNEMSFEWSKCTWDQGDHLNHRGAVIATKYLGTWLSEQVNLVSHKLDSNYEEWNQSLQIYRDMERNNRENLDPEYREVFKYS